MRVTRYIASPPAGSKTMPCSMATCLFKSELYMQSETESTQWPSGRTLAGSWLPLARQNELDKVSICSFHMALACMMWSL